MKLKVFASLAEDINSGWIWLPEAIVFQRSVIKIKNNSSKKSVYCEALQLGDNYLKRYNTNDRTFRIENTNSAVVISEWYRKKLGISSTGETIEFEINVSENPWGHLCACLHHPQIVVRLATELGIISVALGILGIVLAVCL